MHGYEVEKTAIGKRVGLRGVGKDDLILISQWPCQSCADLALHRDGAQQHPRVGEACHLDRLQVGHRREQGGPEGIRGIHINE